MARESSAIMGGWHRPPSPNGTVPAMRHRGSLLAALILGPAAWILLAYGQTDLKPAGDDGRWWEKAAFLAVAGLLVGLVATTRVSPLGPLVAGIVFTGYGVAALWR